MNKYQEIIQALVTKADFSDAFDPDADCVSAMLALLSSF